MKYQLYNKRHINLLIFTKIRDTLFYEKKFNFFKFY